MWYNVNVFYLQYILDLLKSVMNPKTIVLDSSRVNYKRYVLVMILIFRDVNFMNTFK